MSHHSAPKAHASTASNVFQNTNDSTFGSDFGTGHATLDPKTGALTTTSSLSPDLQQARTTAGQGLNQNLGYLAQSPDQVFGQMTAGNNPYYNMLQTQTQRANDQNIAAARLRGAQLGGANSTALGSEMGRLNSDNALQQATNASNAFTLGQNTANQNVGTMQNSITGLANLVYPLASSANSNLMGAENSKNNTSQFNAGQQQQVALANQQAQLQQNQQNSAATGGLINAGLTAAGMIAAPFTGGASMMLPTIGKSVMGGGGMGGGSGVPSIMGQMGMQQLGSGMSMGIT